MDSLRMKYNPEGSQLRKAQLRMLEMMIFLDTTCKKYNIPYWLDCGTLIGAVRHKGFIPWDDDVDIGMMRKEVKRFIKAVEKEQHPNFVIQTKKNDFHFMQDWPVLRDLKSEYIQHTVLHNVRKYRGLQIDIFPFEKGMIKTFMKIGDEITYIKNNDIEKKQLKKAHFIDFICDYFIYPCWRLLGLLKVHQNKYAASYGTLYPTVFIDKPTLFPLKEIEFEGHYFLAPNNANKYLTQYYGPNYMDIPPENDRKTHTTEIKMYF